MYNFEKYRRGARPSTIPQVTIQKRARVSFNKAAYEALGRAQAAELFFDPKEKVIGLRPALPDADDAYTIRKQKKAECYVMSMQGFASYYGIDTCVSHRFRAGVDGGTLTIDTKAPLGDVAARGGGATAAE